MTYSIITINYNNKSGLESTIKSVLSQSCNDYEYIIIDGGSTDGSIEVIQQYAEHITYWVSEPDNGIYHAMNKGVAQAKGDYLSFMNSGDCFYDKDVLLKLKQQVGYDIIEGKVYDMSTRKFSYKSTDKPTMMFFYSGGLGHQACLIRSQLLRDEPYDECLRFAADWKFFVKKIIFDNCSYHFVNLPVVSFEGNGTSTKNISCYDAERQQTLEQLFPPRILADYERFHDKESPMIDLIPYFNKTSGLQKVILSFTKSLIHLYQLIKW